MLGQLLRCRLQSGFRHLRLCMGLGVLLRMGIHGVLIVGWFGRNRVTGTGAHGGVLAAGYANGGGDGVRIAVVFLRTARFEAPVFLAGAAPEQETPEAGEDALFGMAGGSGGHVAHDLLGEPGSGKAFKQRVGSRRLAHHAGPAVPLGSGKRRFETGLARMGRGLETVPAEFFMIGHRLQPGGGSNGSGLAVRRRPDRVNEA
jgi:hypothetical protein